MGLKLLKSPIRYQYKEINGIHTFTILIETDKLNFILPDSDGKLPSFIAFLVILPETYPSDAPYVLARTEVGK